jgi:hypothetical protein
VVLLKGHNIVVFSFFSASEIWTDKRGGALEEGYYCIIK